MIWGQSKPLDNPDNIHVLIYRCKEMANNCGMCLSLDKKYQCGWCEVSATVIGSCWGAIYSNFKDLSPVGGEWGNVVKH